MLAQHYKAAAVQPGEVRAWLLAELNPFSGTGWRPYETVAALCKMHAATQISGQAAAGLLRTAMRVFRERRWASSHVHAILELPAAQQQLDPATAAVFCMADIKARDPNAVERICRCVQHRG